MSRYTAGAMIQLNPDESRVLGVLVEKGLTTPDQYPLSLNALTNGTNQKSNREPVLAMTEDQVFGAVESLRAKGLAVRVDTVGSRVHKYKHNAIEVLQARTAELAILAELLLRGPQTLGELRGRASRMAPLESLDVTRGLLEALMTRPEPYVRQLPPSPGSRAERYVQLLCPDLHPLDAPAPPPIASTSATAGPSASPRPSADPALAERVTKLEAEVAALRESLHKLATALGETIT